MNYTVVDEGEIRLGTAEDIMREIHAKSPGNPEIKALSVEGYADALIENAEYYLSENVIRILEQMHFNTKFDKSLNLLNAMPASDVRIIATQP